MNNLIEFFRMVFSYLFVSVIVCAVSAAGMFVGLKVWKPKAKQEDGSQK